MDLAENRFGKNLVLSFKHFCTLKFESRLQTCSLADVCRDQHTTLE